MIIKYAQNNDTVKSLYVNTIVINAQHNNDITVEFLRKKLKKKIIKK